MCSILGTLLPLRWNKTGTTVAGSATGSTGTAASLLKNPYSLAFDSSDALIITDYMNHRIQKWSSNASNGTTVAGQSNGTSGSSLTSINQPIGIVLDSNNSMYFADRQNHRVMYWANGASSGTVIAGTSGKSNYSIAFLVAKPD